MEVEASVAFNSTCCIVLSTWFYCVVNTGWLWAHGYRSSVMQVLSCHCSHAAVAVDGGVAEAYIHRLAVLMAELQLKLAPVCRRLS